jgi:hypothetical protein
MPVFILNLPDHFAIGQINSHQRRFNQPSIDAASRISANVITTIIFNGQGIGVEDDSWCLIWTFDSH